MKKLEWPEWMDAYPVEFWEDSKVQEYVKMADEYLKTMRVECEKAGDTHEA